MEHAHHHHHSDKTSQPPAPSTAHRPTESLNRTAMTATLHCLLGCAIGEVAGLMIGTALGWGNVPTIALAVTLAFISGFALTTIPFLKRGFGIIASVKIALAADTASITVMEIIDNGLMIWIPGAMDAPLDSLLFWSSMTVSLLIAGLFAFPLNRWLIARGKGHALVHHHH